MKTHLDLFSGLGGFALAAGWAGYNTIGFCEVEDYPRRILSKRFPGVRLHGDIRELDGADYQGVTLITGGYPCQPFSAAGKRKGAADDRHLWPEMLRVVKQARPAWVLAENVAGHITMGLDEVLADLEGEGYAARAVVVPACAVDAPHRRDRVWIVAKNVGNSTSGRGSAYGSQPESGFERMGAGQADRSGSPSPDVAHSDSTGNRLETHRSCGQGWQSARASQPTVLSQGDRSSCPEGSGASGKDVAHSDSKRKQSRDSERQDAEDAGQSSRGAEHGTGITEPHLGRGTDGLSEGLDMPRRWSDGSWEDGVPRVTVGAKNRTQRLKALGNAIVPQVAYELIRHLETHG